MSFISLPIFCIAVEVAGPDWIGGFSCRHGRGGFGAVWQESGWEGTVGASLAGSRILPATPQGGKAFVALGSRPFTGVAVWMAAAPFPA